MNEKQITSNEVKCPTTENDTEKVGNTGNNTPPPIGADLHGIDAIRAAAGDPSEATVIRWLTYVDCPIVKSTDGQWCADRAALLAWVAMLPERERLQTRPETRMERRRLW